MTQSHDYIVIIKNAAYIPAMLLLGGVDGERFFILTMFMALDFVLGVTRVLVVQGGRALKSYKMAAGILSKILITCVPLILVWAGKGSGIEFAKLAEWSMGALVLSQAYSIMGNINSIRLKQDTHEWDAVSFILERIRMAIELVLKDTSDKQR